MIATGGPGTTLSRNQLWARLTVAVEEAGPLPTPLVVVDLDAFDANATDLCKRASGVPIRVASKSLRVPALIDRALAADGFAGVLGYTLAEALWLHGHGCPDVVVAYPSVDVAAIDTLLTTSAVEGVTLMVDSTEHLDLVDSRRTAGTDAEVRVAIDVDAGLRVAGQHVGPRRSPLREVSDVLAVALEVVRRPGFRLVGAMSYEGQVAGVPDDVPGQRTRSAIVRRIKTLSLAQLATRRREVADALADVAPLEFFNGGGSGSLQDTAADPVVTEVTAGSGLLVPTSFDHFASFVPRPASYFALPVTRRPSGYIATVQGGGLVASGPAGPDRLPTPWAPAGLELLDLEGAGEVQTPLTGRPAALLEIGDLVWFRHAKSGELFEHTTTAHLLSGNAFVDAVPTYRGHGLAF